jgi:methionyl-tRNA formyltransferase
MIETANPLRVGVMLDSLTVPAWIAHVLRQLAEAPFVELALVVLNAEPRPPAPRFARLRSPRRHHLLFQLYARVDRRVFRRDPDAFAEVAMADELRSVPKREVVPLRPRRFEHRFAAEAIDEIRAADLDVLIRFGFNIIRGEILECARYGVWSYHHGDNREYRGSPDFFWEMYEGNPVTGTMLGVLTDELDAGRVLYRSFSATDPTSMQRGRNPAYWKSADFVIRRLTDLHQRGWSALESRAEFREKTEYTKNIYRKPSNGQMLRFVVRLASGMLARQVRDLVFRDLWYIGYRRIAARRRGLVPTAAELRVTDSDRFRLMGAPPGRYWADPFVVHHDGRHHVFFEDYDLASGKGVISSACLNGKGVLGPAKLALERDYHLSYPFVFRWDGDWYMTPETGEQRAIELFKAVEFPDRWGLERVLMRDVDAVDPTMLEHDGRFWLFANIAVPGAAIDDELFLFHADSPRGAWHSHPQNPVVSDVRRSRPAGRVFLLDGMLIRPSQDCSRRYGFATVFNRISKLSETEYEETPIGRLDPGWMRGNRATHTFNGDDGYEVLDAQRRTFKLLRARQRSMLRRD